MGRDFFRDQPLRSEARCPLSTEDLPHTRRAVTACVAVAFAGRRFRRSGGGRTTHGYQEPEGGSTVRDRLPRRQSARNSACSIAHSRAGIASADPVSDPDPNLTRVVNSTCSYDPGSCGAERELSRRCRAVQLVTDRAGLFAPVRRRATGTAPVNGPPDHGHARRPAIPRNDGERR